MLKIDYPCAVNHRPRAICLHERVLLQSLSQQELLIDDLSQDEVSTDVSPDITLPQPVKWYTSGGRQRTNDASEFAESKPNTRLANTQNSPGNQAQLSSTVLSLVKDQLPGSRDSSVHGSVDSVTYVYTGSIGADAPNCDMTNGLKPSTHDTNGHSKLDHTSSDMDVPGVASNFSG